MAHEKPGDGRTDAELLKQMAKNASEGGPWKDWTSFVDQACQRGLEYLSGTRPMPTDEVAALTARVAELEAELAGYRHPGGVIVGHSVEGGGWGVFEQTSPGEYMRIAGPFPTRDEAEAEMRGLPKPAPGAEGGDK